VVEERLPGGQACQGDGRALNMTDGAGLPREERSRDHGVLGGRTVTIEAGERPDGLADAEIGHVGSKGGDHSRQLVGGDRGQPIDPATQARRG
jgi:hypothetical protein